MTIRQYIDSLPNIERLTARERHQLLYGLALDNMTDKHGISLTAYMPQVADRLVRLLDKARNNGR